MIGRLLPLGVFVLLAVLLAVGLTIADRKSELPSPLIGKDLPSFSLPVLGQPGSTVSDHDLLGEPFLLNVWASWCVTCRYEHPLIEELAASGRIKVVGLNYRDDEQDALDWLDHFGNPYAVNLSDTSGRVAIDFGVYAAPESFYVAGSDRTRDIRPARRRNRPMKRALCLLAIAFACAASAQQEPLRFDDPDNEQRFVQLTEELRCLVCQNQNLADSDAPLAHDLRQEIFEMMQAGRTDDEIKTFLVERYGDFVLYRPPMKGNTLMLWAMPGLLLLLGAVALTLAVRRRSRLTATADSGADDHPESDSSCSG